MADETFDSTPTTRLRCELVITKAAPSKINEDSGFEETAHGMSDFAFTSLARQTPKPAVFAPHAKKDFEVPDFSFANSVRRTKIDNHPTGGCYGLHPGA